LERFWFRLEKEELERAKKVDRKVLDDARKEMEISRYLQTWWIEDRKVNKTEKKDLHSRIFKFQSILSMFTAK